MSTETRNEKTRIFDLEDRQSPHDPFETVEQVRAYDRNARSSMIIPMQHCMKLLEPSIKPGSKVLELSCGAGILSLRLAAAHRDAEFYGIERNDACLEVTRENTIFANLVNYGGNFVGEWGKLTSLPFPDAEFDVVFAFCAMGRWQSPQRVLEECRRVLKPGGTVLLYDLARDASEGMISFVLQYASGDADQFMRSLRTSFTAAEAREMLDRTGLSGWSVAKEGINLIISSSAMEVDYQVGASGIYEDIFPRGGVPGA